MSVQHQQLFQQYMAQTTNSSMNLEIERAEGVWLYGPNGEKYLDFISGISVSNLGHKNPKVVQAVKEQVDKYMHLMVYGEYVQSPQVQLGEAICAQLHDSLDNIYMVNSGSEAIEGAMKLAKRATGRPNIAAMKHAYHGSTQGALSLMGDESFRRAYRPLLPGIKHLNFNSTADFKHIDKNTAAVIVEPVQGASGYVTAEKQYLHALSQHCKKVGALLVFDEIQSGFGRTGHLFAHQAYGVVPDILTLAKGMGGGMPIGAFVANSKLMREFTHNPMLGHITTFGGHPVSAAAALASLKFILEEQVLEAIPQKHAFIKENLKHPAIKEIRGMGLMLAVQLNSFEEVQEVVNHCRANGLISNWFIFCSTALRICPPLTISKEELDFACKVLLKALDKIG